MAACVKVFKPNASTQNAVEHPARYGFGIGLTLAIIIGLGGLLAGGFPATVGVGVAVGLMVGAANYLTFRPGGWGARWFERNRPT